MTIIENWIIDHHIYPYISNIVNLSRDHHQITKQQAGKSHHFHGISHSFAWQGKGDQKNYMTMENQLFEDVSY